MCPAQLRARTPVCWCVQYRRARLDLVMLGTDSACLVVPSLTQNVMVKVEFC